MNSAPLNIFIIEKWFPLKWHVYVCIYTYICMYPFDKVKLICALLALPGEREFNDPARCET
jgi:hypothetical protein